MVEAESLTKRFADVTAVENVSFSVDKGEVVGFLGPNGAGKTTIMRILAGYIPPTAGRATVAGVDVMSGSVDVRCLIGYLPENVPLYPEMRVREYLKFRAKIKGVPSRKREGNISRVMGQCGVTDVASKPIRHLSKGYRQRVGLADALVHDPQILILDEPTIGLDPNQIRQVRDLIRQLGDSHTIILSTHILPEVEAICKRFIILNEGRITVTDTMDYLRQARRISVSFDSVPEEAEKALASVPGVNHVVRKGSAFLLETTERENIEKYIFEMAVSKSWVLTELKKERKTLEEIFVAATMRDGKE